eukprot:1509942-Pleurochrysis_carterae.AAC.2
MGAARQLPKLAGTVLQKFCHSGSIQSRRFHPLRDDLLNFTCIISCVFGVDLPIFRVHIFTSLAGYGLCYHAPLASRRQSSAFMAVQFGQQVRDAYLNPHVDRDETPFEWARPDLQVRRAVHAWWTAQMCSLSFLH